MKEGYEKLLSEIEEEFKALTSKVERDRVPSSGGAQRSR